MPFCPFCICFEAFVKYLSSEALTHSMALIQGPPGTGKHPSQWNRWTHLDTVQQLRLHWFQALAKTPKQRKD